MANSPEQNLLVALLYEDVEAVMAEIERTAQDSFPSLHPDTQEEFKIRLKAEFSKTLEKTVEVSRG